MKFVDSRFCWLQYARLLEWICFDMLRLKSFLLPHTRAQTVFCSNWIILKSIQQGIQFGNLATSRLQQMQSYRLPFAFPCCFFFPGILCFRAWWWLRDFAAGTKSGRIWLWPGILWVDLGSGYRNFRFQKDRVGKGLAALPPDLISFLQGLMGKKVILWDG